MSKYIGRRVKIGVGAESTRGTEVAPSYALKQMEFSHSDKVNKARDASGLGVLASESDAEVVTKWAEGNFSGNVGLNVLGVFLKALLGAVSTTADSPESGVNTHAFSINNINQHPSLTLVREDPIEKVAYTKAMIDSLSFEVSLEDWVKISVGFKSNPYAVSSQTIPAVAPDYKFVKSNVTVKVADTVAGLSGAVALPLKSYGLDVAKNVQPDDAIGSSTPEDFTNGEFKASGKLSLNLEDKTWRGYMLNGTKKAMQLKFESTSNITGKSTKASLTVVLPYVDFEGWEPSEGLSDIAMQEISFNALYDIANGLEPVSSCSLVNTVASY